MSKLVKRLLIHVFGLFVVGFAVGLAMYFLENRAPNHMVFSNDVSSISLSPGGSSEIVVNYERISDKELKSLKSWVSDIEANKDGVFVPLEGEGANRNRSTWIENSGSKQRASLTAQVNYKVNVPEDTATGSYFIGVVTEYSNKKKELKLFNVQVDNPKVPEIHGVYMEQPEYENGELLTSVWNSGTVTEDVQIRLELTTMEGESIIQKDLELGNVFEHSRRHIALKLPSELETGQYVVNSVVVYNGTKLEMSMYLNVEGVKEDDNGK